MAEHYMHPEDWKGTADYNKKPTATVSITPERLKELEDAERIAWAMARGFAACGGKNGLDQFNLPQHLYPVIVFHAGDFDFHSTPGALGWVQLDRIGFYPILRCKRRAWEADKFRAIIDAARREAGATEEGSKQ